VSEVRAHTSPETTGFHVLRADDLSNAELSTLHALARVRLHADGRPLMHHVQAWMNLHEKAFEERNLHSVSAVPIHGTSAAQVSAPIGEFAIPDGEFSFSVGAHLRPKRPWINVLSNPGFGTQISEAGAGYTWAVNSRMNQLTAWSNDPVCDPPSEWFLLQDLKTQALWSVTPNTWGDANAVYRVTHGQGYSTISHRRGDLEVSATWCVDPQTSVKQVSITLKNQGPRVLNLRAIGIAEWMMGEGRADRCTVRTGIFRQHGPERQLTALLGTQREQSAGFGDGTAFFSLTTPASATEDWTCDRRECFDARGRLVLPDHFDQKSGDGLDPCAALSSVIVLSAGQSEERVFQLGYAENESAATRLAVQAAALTQARRLEAVRSTWNQLLSAAVVKTPDPLFDVMVNRWLLYQTLTCRLWAKAGFYQAGGATGFRDQLQDAMALAWAAPQMLRQQIVLCASRQFPQGDVQHWWHAPGGAGVRTHFSDDLLWLAFATQHYLNATGDTALLDERVPFLEGAAIAEGAEDAYYTPSVTAYDATIYEHAALAIDHSLRVGIHGLPLMGSGDWNDGMNRVGIEGRGESVWLGWFLCRLVADFAPMAQARGDTERAQRWQSAATGWNKALMSEAWDGQWFRRAFFDDGSALGSNVNPQARIDLIAQVWAVLSKAAPRDLQHKALAAVEAHLVDAQAGLIRLLDPPLVDALPNAGYIQAYPPGVRENGGQYSHAGIWALMAVADFASSPDGHENGIDTDTAYRYFTYLSPAHRASHPTRGAAYGIEPYVIAGDVYSQPPYVGQGGWSWYTGAAAWLHRAAIESIFGLRQGAETLVFQPCLPSHWHQAELQLSREGRSMRFILIRANAHTALIETAAWGAQLLRIGQSLQWPALATHSCFVIPLLAD
jgi:cyclic beta-1,2-glucan synthetase